MRQFSVGEVVTWIPDLLLRWETHGDYRIIAAMPDQDGHRVYRIAASEDELEPAFATLAQAKAGALLIAPDGLFVFRAAQVAALTVRHAIPASHERRAFPVAGGLMSYRREPDGRDAPCRRLGRPGTQGRETRRPAGAASHQIRISHQPQDREGARSRRAANAAGPCRRGDRMSARGKAGAIQPVEVRPK